MASGRVPGRAERSAVDAEALGAFAKRQLQKSLQDENFEMESPLLFSRQLEGIVQMIVFEVGTGKLSGLFNVGVGWRIDLYEQAPGTFHVRKHLGMLDNGCDRWFGKGSDDGFDEVERMLVDSAIPFLTRHDSIKKLLKLYDRAGYKHMGMFGTGDAWIELHVGLCHEYEGKWTEARRHLKAALAAKKTGDSLAVDALAKEALARIDEEDGVKPEDGTAPVPRRRRKYQR